MGQTIILGGAIVSLVDVDFNCPVCGCPHNEDDYQKRLHKSNTGLIYKQCKGCKTKLGITSDMRGDVVVWLKDEEKKQRKYYDLK